MASQKFKKCKISLTKIKTLAQPMVGDEQKIKNQFLNKNKLYNV